ncbi:DSD1 family PLP-dependent enzyme [Telmatospirillum sp.]|uniref:DSD1 family PLP-dependent enzyme n=1 Tax=Telmatospirillum sp. TaxID=2079197 RepID=UPI00283AE30E|nr:DSD1 family PLP-dependent enzyme [Telmatospirillum sp.]MDR3435281.1 DSD1 family PLP-dependent enzyme [Telmatospirillum sp.]
MPIADQTPSSPLLPRRLGDLVTPGLLLDQDRLERNVARMRDRLTRLNVGFRPHLKTAKSIEVARRVMDRPSGPAMVSTLREAEYFADHGVRDLTYGVGIAPGKLDRIGALRRHHGVELTIILDSLEQAEAVAVWSTAQGYRLPVLIEIDADGHRSGVPPEDGERLIAIGRKLHDGGSALRGVLTHAGDSYTLSRPDDLAAAAAAERTAAVGAGEILRAAGLPCPVVSIGSTPTASFAQDLAGVTELRAGVFMFGDLVQTGIGACTSNDIAISVLATVIGHQRAKGWTIVDAGWMALSRDRGTSRQAVDQGYGLVCDEAGAPFPDLLVLDANQEHGIIGARPGSGEKPPDLPVGSLVRILPNHACATAAQHDRYHVLAPDRRVIAQWPRIGGW